MKKLLRFSIACLVCCTFNAIAQIPVLEGTYLPVRGTSIKQVYDTVDGHLAIPSLGANQYWDYSTQFIPQSTYVLASFDPANTPYAKYFLKATHASFLRAPFYDGDSLFSYFRIDTMGVWGLGGFSIQKGVDTSFIAIKEEFVLPAKGTYGTAFQDTSKFYGFGKYFYQGSWYNIKKIQTKYKSTKAEGYGTLKSPIGSFSQVLLAKESNKLVDTFLVDILKNGNYVFIPQVPPKTVQFDRYYFLRNNTFGSTILMELQSNAAKTMIDYGWYTLPVDVGSIAGTIRDSSGSLLSNGDNEALLYRENSNFSKNDILMRSKVDVNGRYLFDSIPFGIYRIAVRADTGFYKNSLTTYYGNTSDWLNAKELKTITAAKDTDGVDIKLLYHAPLNGTNEISGKLMINLGINKTNTTGDPVPGIDVSLEQVPGGNIKSQIKTDSLTGKFNVKHLPDAAYKLFVDIPGLHMAGTYSFTVSGGKVIDNLDYVVGRDSIHPVNSVITTIPKVVAATEAPHAYPNPFSHTVTFKTTHDNNPSEVMNIVVYDIVGHQIWSAYLHGKNEIIWDGKNSFGTEVPSGIYLYTIKQNGTIFQSGKLVKE